MPDSARNPTNNGLSFRQRFDRLARARPDIVLIGPFMAYLLFMALLQLDGVIPQLKDVLWWKAAAHAIRGVGVAAVIWLFWKHFPPLGRPYWGIAILAGIVAAAGWAGGQHFFDRIGIPPRLPFLFPGPRTVTDPHTELGYGALFWTTITLKIAVAVLIVPIVEELFWRGFLLRAFINWDDFEKVPPGRFTWFSFLGTALLSTVQHPENWFVSIFCWMFYNALFYWKRSLLCLMITHGITNLVLYVYVVAYGDWMFW